MPLNRDYQLLHVTDGYGDHKYYADGRRITKDRYHDLWNAAARIDSVRTVRRNSAWYHYSSARAAPAPTSLAA